jgi:hypothetical protein
MKGSSRSGDQTSAQELVLAKALKLSQKFSSQPSGLSVMENTSPANVKISGDKTSSTSAGGGGLIRALAHALDLFDPGSSASDDEVIAPVTHRKHLQKSPPLKGTSAQSSTCYLY